MRERETNNEKGDVGTGGYNGRGSAHWSARLKKGWIFERASRCKGWSARARSSVEAACVLRKTEREREKGQKRLEKGARDDDPGKEAERERERNKKRKKIYACARSAFSARVHLSYEPSLELVSHKFPRKLVSEIRHFSHPRWLLLLLFSSMSRVPSASYAASIVVPLFYEKLALDKRSTEKIEPPTNRECSPFRVPYIHACLRAHYAPVITIRPLRLIFFFFFISIPWKMPRRKDRVERGRKTGRELFVCSRFFLRASFPFFMFSLSVRG